MLRKVGPFSLNSCSICSWPAFKNELASISYFFNKFSEFSYILDSVECRLKHLKKNISSTIWNEDLKCYLSNRICFTPCCDFYLVLKAVKLIILYILMDNPDSWIANNFTEIKVYRNFVELTSQTLTFKYLLNLKQLFLNH